MTTAQDILNFYNINLGNKEGRFVDNGALNYLSGLAYQLGQSLIPFNLDIAKEGSLLNYQSPLGGVVLNEIVAYYITMGYSAPTSELGYRVLVNDYFMRAGLCYTEIKNTKSTEKAASDKNTEYLRSIGIQNIDSRYSAVKSKMITTKNSELLALFTGTGISEVENYYARNLGLEDYNITNGDVPYTKVDIKDNAFKVVRCNKDLVIDYSRMTSIPLTQYWLMGVSEAIQTKMVKITVKKDDDTDREIVTTLNRDIVAQHYKPEQVNNMFEACVCTTQVDARFWTPFNSNLLRGWVQFIELGSSSIDDNGTRAVNIARILKMEVVDTFDTSYINVALTEVINSFNNFVEEYSVKSDLVALKNIYNALKTYGFSSQLTVDVSVFPTKEHLTQALLDFTRANYYVGTAFKKHLHTYMIKNINLFPSYIGIKLDAPKQAVSYGVKKLDF